MAISSGYHAIKFIKIEISNWDLFYQNLKRKEWFSGKCYKNKNFWQRKVLSTLSKSLYCVSYNS